MRRITILLLMTMVAALVMASGVAWAANAGDLDTSFGGDGRVVYDVFGGVDDSAQAVVIQPDGKIVVAGSWCGFGNQCRTGTFAIARFNPNGTLDTAFGNSGRILVAFPNGRAVATGVQIQADGKIVAAGWRNDDDDVNDADFALVRLEPDGDLDPSFSGDGKAMNSFDGSDNAEAVAIQGNGKIVVAGHTTGCGDIDFAIARYNANGSLDTTFSGDGEVCTGFGEWEWAHGVVVQTDGKIVAAGSSYDRIPCGLFDGCYRDIAIARYNANGSLDRGFDGDGKVRTELRGEEFVWGATIQSNDKVVVAGATDGCGGDYDFLLARYNTDGSEDSSFEGGSVCTELGNYYDQAEGVAVQANSRIVAAGTKGLTGSDFAIARYRTDGSLDSSFANDGTITTSFGGADTAHGVAIQADGGIVVAGSTDVGGDYDIAIARYHAITDNSATKSLPTTTSPRGGSSQ
jgi:uncharacterized delta-60 repeat protein